MPTDSKRAIWALVPLKAPDLAKSRLAPALAPDARRTLFFLMAAQVLRAVRQTPSIAGLAVVTPSLEVAAFAQPQGALIIDEPRPGGMIPATNAALAALQARGAKEVLILPGDLPLAHPAALEAVVAGETLAPSIGLVADHRRDGTNALLLNPPDAIALAFGSNSFSRHLADAERRHVAARILDAPALAFDIDDAADLEALRRVLRAAPDPPWMTAARAALDPALRAFILA